MELKELFDSMAGRTIERLALTADMDVEIRLDDGRTITLEAAGEGDLLVGYDRVEEQKARQ